MKKVLLTAVLILYGGNLEAQSVKRFTVQDSKVEQGGTLVFQISPYWMPPATTNPTIYIFEKHHKPNAEGKVFVGVDLDTKPGKYDAVFYVNGIWQCCDKEEIEVTATSSEKTRISAYTGRPAQRTDRQKRAIDKVFADGEKSDGSTDLTGGLSYANPLCFTLDVIDPFGFIYRNNPYRKHEGVDLRAPVGMAVMAVNAGKVVMVARNFRREGNMVIISHGLGIFSVYMHLSKFEVKLGDMVERGQLIALTGRTGIGIKRGEEHLHFSMKIRSSYVDPRDFIETANKVLK